jgi:putative tricarboxylic transport membrane protein
MTNVKAGEWVIASLLLLFSLTFLVYVMIAFPAGERIYPGILFFLLAAFSLIQLIKLLLLVKKQRADRKKQEGADRRESLLRNRNIWLAIGATCLYIAVLDILGFTLSSFLFIFGLTLILGYRKYLVIIVIDLAIIACVYLLFTKLNVPVPEGKWLDMFSGFSG